MRGSNLMRTASFQNTSAIGKVMGPAEASPKGSSQVNLQNVLVRKRLQKNEHTHDITYIDVFKTSYVRAMPSSVHPEHICR